MASIALKSLPLSSSVFHNGEDRIWYVLPLGCLFLVVSEALVDSLAKSHVLKEFWARLVAYTLLVIFVLVAQAALFTTGDYVGNIAVPSSIYEGHSSAVRVVLSSSYQSAVEKIFDGANDHAQDLANGGKIRLRTQVSIDKIEVELQAAGLQVSGDSKQAQPTTASWLTYDWSCHFAESGKYLLSFIFRGIQHNGGIVELGKIDAPVTVYKIAGLTGAQVWWIGLAGAMITGIVAFALSCFTLADRIRKKSG